MVSRHLFARFQTQSGNELSAFLFLHGTSLADYKRQLWASHRPEGKGEGSGLDGLVPTDEQLPTEARPGSNTNRCPPDFLVLAAYNAFHDLMKFIYAQQRVEISLGRL